LESIEQHCHFEMGTRKELFAEAAQIFLADRLQEAGKVFGALFQLLRRGESSMEQSPELLVSESELDVDLREARARYCRCVYETCTPENRNGFRPRRFTPIEERKH
jgi:hypothetical protein